MSPTPAHVCPPRLSLLELLLEHGWKPIRVYRGEELAGLCPWHRESRPSFFVNCRKQVFYCHGCRRGGGRLQLVRLLQICGGLPVSGPTVYDSQAQLLEQTYRFYQGQLARTPRACAYLAQRGIHDPMILQRMRIG